MTVRQAASIGFGAMVGAGISASTRTAEGPSNADSARSRQQSCVRCPLEQQLEVRLTRIEEKLTALDAPTSAAAGFGQRRRAQPT